MLRVIRMNTRGTLKRVLVGNKVQKAVQEIDG